MKKITLILFCLITCASLFAQKEYIDLKGLFTGKYRIENMRNLSWRPETHQYTYIEDNKLMMANAETSETSVFCTLPQIATALGGDIKGFPGYQWIGKDQIYIPGKQSVVTFNGDKLEVEKIPVTNAFDGSVKNRLFVVREDDGNVYVRSGKNNYEPILLCPDTGKGIVFGEAVHRSEWGIEEGQYLSPNGNYIAFYRMDESMVADYPLVNVNTRIATVENCKYPMAGETSHEVTLGIFDVSKSAAAGKTVYHYIRTDKEDGEFLTNVTFSPDEKYIYITHLNREQNHSKLIEYDLLTGKKSRTLIEERDDRYVEPLTRMIFISGDRFIWQSDRDGWNHMYLYSRDGKLIKQIIKGNWPVISVIGTDPKDENIFFITNKNILEDKDMPIDRYVYSVNIKSGKLRALAQENGTHTPRFSTDKQYFLDYFSNLFTPNNIDLYSINGKVHRNLLSAKNPYEKYHLDNVSIFPIKNKAGDDLYCRLILPPDFDASKKYPCLIYVYGGPHSQMVTNTFMSGGIFLYYLAQKGYIVFTLDNRGTSYRGSAFEKCIHRQLGKLEVEDQMCGVEYLKSLACVDTTRIGIDGWSYGGFMTLSLMTTHPEAFKAATCGGPVIDWKWYEVMYGERYMDTPQENPEGYENSSILNKIKNLKGDVLVIHGAQDNTVVWQHTQALLNQAIHDGIQLDYFVYPNHPHNVGGLDRVHLWNKLEKYYEEHLR